jgi:hypothetical protein
MDKLETAIDLATAIVKGGCLIWAGPLAAVPNTIADLVNAKVTSKLQQRRAERFFENCVDTVAEKLLELMNQRGKDVNITDLNASIYAVRDTFDLASIKPISLIKADLDARTLERSMEPARSEILRRALLSESGRHFYDLLLRESCTYALEFVSTLPHYEVAAFAEILKRETLIISSLQEVLSRLPDRESVDDFAADYRRLVIQRLDRMQLFGAKLQSDYGRRYPLSVAYVSLSATSTSPHIGNKDSAPNALDVDYATKWPTGPESVFRASTTNPYPLGDRQRFLAPQARYITSSILADPKQGSVAGEVSVEHWLASEDRLLFIGEAGSGKSTLLQWLAVRAARGDFEGELTRWNAYMPFFIPLRRFAEGLPAPESFPASVGKNIIDAMPKGWVHGHLKSGRALMLIDGLDELREGAPRSGALEWLQELIESFPLCSYVLTSRPAAVEGGLVLPPLFKPLELRSMTPTRIRRFVEHWHDAMRVELPDREEQEGLSADQASLLSTLETDRYVRALCVSPLLCALVCALNRERHGHLPKDRMGVYRGALEMLLDMRDRERGIVPSLEISHEAKVTLLQDLAFYLVRNAWSDAPIDRVREQITRSSRMLNDVTAGSDEVLRFLLERSGLIRTPSEGRVDFIHRSFQEYLAGKAAVDNDEIGYLLQHATDDQFRDVIVMAVGHAQPRQAEELLRGLISQINSASEAAPTILQKLRHNIIMERDETIIHPREAMSHRLKLLALACLQTVLRINPDLRKQIEGMAHDLLPPESFDIAPTLAAAGPIVLDLMAERPAVRPSQAAASIRVASLVAGRDAMLFIADLAGRFDGVEDEVVRAWSEFNLAEYSDTVIPKMRWSGRLTVTDPSLLPYISKMDGLAELTVPADIIAQKDFPPRPRGVHFLRVLDNATKNLEVLRGWDDITFLEIHLESLNVKLDALRKFKQLKGLRVVSTHPGMLGLGPLGSLRSLNTIQLAAPPQTCSVRVNALRESRDLTIYVPPNVTVIGGNEFKDRSRVIIAEELPDLF